MERFALEHDMVSGTDLTDLHKMEKEIFDLRQLLEISRALNSTLDFHALTDAILDMSLAQMQTLQAALFLSPDPDPGFLLPEDGFRWPGLESNLESLRFYRDFPFLKLLEKRREAVSVGDLLEQIPHCPSIPVLKSLGASLVSPLIDRDGLGGVIFLGSRVTGDGYTTSERRFMTDLASLASVALRNARLYHRSTTDPLTGLHNHGYLLHFLNREMELAGLAGESLALMMIDVDRFKEFNDALGHQVGDSILKGIAQVLGSTIRRGDLAARYGGDEFAIVLPRASIRSALGLAERIRERVEQALRDVDANGLKVTLCVGVAAMDLMTGNPGSEVLLKRADMALLEAKRSGRNRILHYSPGVAGTDM